MRLTDAEQAMLNGEKGPARAKAMQLLVRYGEALGAEKLVETNNVCTTVGSATPFMRDYAARGFDAVYSEFNLDSREIVETPPASAHTCQLIHGIDTRNWKHQNIPEDLVETQKKSEAFFGERGVKQLATCTPYQVGNVPARGEHCAWMESSAVVYCNAVLGACTNTEGRESASAASITNRIPDWGLHRSERRFATHHVRVLCNVDDMMEWGLLGYHIGEIIQDEIPALDGIRAKPDMPRLKHFGAAASSSGGVEMYHIPGITPEAATLEAAFGGKKPVVTIEYGAAERRSAYENLNSQAKDRDVDFVMLGCPHNSLEQVRIIAQLVEGRRVHANSALWIHTPRDIRDIADREGLSKIIEAAGGLVMSDTCPAISRAMPKGVKVVATDSAKQAHYLPAITGVQAWFGSLADCIDAATTGRWNGRLQ